MKHKTIQQLRDNLKTILKRARPKQLKKLRKAYHGKRLKKWWSSYASWECCKIEELKDAEHVGHRMKGGHNHNHIRNVKLRKGERWQNWNSPTTPANSATGKSTRESRCAVTS